MKPISLTGFALCLTLSLAAQDRQEFRNPSAHYRPKPLWFWNDTRITREGIDEQMAGFVRRCGYGGFSILPFGPRLAPEYLSGDYFELYRHTARKAAELGVTLSLYDEYGFPSGSGGWVNADGVPRFANRYPDLTLKPARQDRGGAGRRRGLRPSSQRRGHADGRRRDGDLRQTSDRPVGPGSPTDGSSGKSRTDAGK